MQNWGALSGWHESQEVAGGPQGPHGAGPALQTIVSCWFIPAGILPFPLSQQGPEKGTGIPVKPVQLPGKNILNKIHLNQPFLLVNHKKQHFGKSRHFLLWQNKNFVLQDSNFSLVVLCSGFTLIFHHQCWSHQHFGGCGTFGRALGTAGDRTPVWVEIGSYTVWPLLHK